MATLYLAAYTAATASPTWARADIGNGRNGWSSSGYITSGTNSSAPTSGSGADASVGITLSGLSAGTDYKLWLIWDDGSTSSNGPISSATFTTLDPKTVEVPAGSLTLTGFAPSVAASDNKTVSVPAGSLTLTAFAPTVTAPALVAVPAGSLTLTGFAPTVTVSANVDIQVPAGSLTLTAFAPTVTAPALVEVSAGALTLTSFAPDVHVTSGTTVQVPAGSLTLTGYAPTVAASSSVTVDVPKGTLALTGYAPTVVAVEDPVPFLTAAGITNVSLTSVRPRVTLTFEQIFPDGLINLEYDPVLFGDEYLSVEET